MEGQSVYMLTIEDISVRKRAEQVIVERTEQLEAANRDLEAFSYSVSHDLRAPLRAVDGFSRILEEDFEAELTSDARHYLKLVRDNTRQMATLIDDLLAFSRLGRHPIRKSRVNTSELVERAIEEATSFQNGKSPQVQVDQLPDCEADPALLKQVLLNLISNAVKFSRHSDLPMISIGCERKAGDPETYYVRDNGVGFDMTYAPKLFGVFQRLHRAEEYEGTGVGLAIVHRIISRHGGHVWADSRPGAGATFYFTLGGQIDGSSGHIAG
jgi:light-regulated signal transduction histidine kinase (bacteriophytochrome)